MSQPKKRVVTTKKKTVATRPRKTVATSSRRRTTVEKTAGDVLIFGKRNYILMAAGFGIVLLGLLLMAGGAQPDPNEWDEDIIYNWRRIVLAPAVILAGLGLEIYAIFAKSDDVEATDAAEI